MSCLTFSARPDDNFVKQFLMEEAGQEWKIYAGSNYFTFNCTIGYHFEIINNLNLLLEYNYNYNEYSYSDECKYKRELFLIGIEKCF